MAAKKRKQGKGGILKVIMAVASVSRFADNLIRLVSVRARQAGRSLFALVVLGFLFAALLVVCWLSCMAMLYVYMVSILWTPFASILFITCLNLILLALVMVLIKRAKTHLDDSLSSSC